MPQTGRIQILADDLSGAAELAGVAFRHGLSAEVHRAPGLKADADVVAIDTDSRLLAPDAAASRIHTAVQNARRSGPPWFFKKVDSLLRGNVRAEIEAVMQATGLARAVLVPANPSRGRTVVAGQYLVDGQPLAGTPLAADLHHPRQTSEVRALLGGGATEIHLIKPDDSLPEAGIAVPDVTSEADLMRIAERTDENTLICGAAEFFQTLLERRVGVQVAADLSPVELKPTAALICGSRVTWSERLQACQAVPMPVVLADGSGEGPLQFRAFLLGIGEAEQADPASALAKLAGIASAMIPAFEVETLLLEGGATAAAIAQRQAWHRFAVVAVAPLGVGVLRPLAVQPDQEPPGAPLVLIKPGSYPWPSEIWDAFCNLARV